MTRIDNYICESVSTLIRRVDNGLLLDEIFIDKEYRNKGFGSSIIKNYVLNHAENIYLWVYKNNINTFNLYKKLDFKIKEETDARYYMEYSE